MCARSRALVLAAALAVCAPAAPAPAADTVMPVRAADVDLGREVAAAAALSPTLARLVARVGELGGIVYVRWDPAMPRTREGQLEMRVRRVPGACYLWVALRPASLSPHTLGVVAHELQHAVEALESGAATDEDLAARFRGDGRARAVYETAAAQETGLQVERELRSSTARTSERAGRRRGSRT